MDEGSTTRLERAIGKMKEDISGEIKGLTKELSKFRTSLAVTQASLGNCRERLGKVEATQSKLMWAIIGALGVSVVTLGGWLLGG